jgi:hypothetical protein
VRAPAEPTLLLPHSLVVPGVRRGGGKQGWRWCPRQGSRRPDRGLLVSGAGALLDRDRRDLRYVYVIDEVASLCTSSVRAHGPGEPAGPLLPVVPRRGGTAARPAVAWQPDPSPVSIRARASSTGIWGRLTTVSPVLLLVVNIVLPTSVMVTTAFASRRLGFSPQGRDRDRVRVSKRSLPAVFRWPSCCSRRDSGPDRLAADVVSPDPTNGMCVAGAPLRREAGDAPAGRAGAAGRRRNI